MKQKLESILNKGMILFLAGLISLIAGCASIKHYVEPRLGAIIPVTEQKQDYTPSFLIGGAYGFSKGMFGLEAGLDYFHSSGEYIETNSFLPRVNVSYNPAKSTAKIKPYFIGGVSLLNEISKINIPEFNVYDTVKNTTFGLDFGFGITLLDRLNLRATYTVMPTSENVKEMITLTGGYRFRFGKKK